ncbi:unnamed protein product, partial [Brenthis ino]
MSIRRELSGRTKTQLESMPSQCPIKCTGSKQNEEVDIDELYTVLQNTFVLSDCVAMNGQTDFVTVSQDLKNTDEMKNLIENETGYHQKTLNDPEIDFKSDDEE